MNAVSLSKKMLLMLGCALLFIAGGCGGRRQRTTKTVTTQAVQVQEPRGQYVVTNEVSQPAQSYTAPAKTKTIRKTKQTARAKPVKKEAASRKSRKQGKKTITKTEATPAVVVVKEETPKDKDAEQLAEEAVTEVELD